MYERNFQALQDTANPFFVELASKLLGVFSSDPLSSGTSSVVTTLFPESRLFSISVETRDDILLTGRSGVEQQSMPKLLLQSIKSSLAGQVLAKQCARVLRCGINSTGLADADSAFMDFHCNTILAVPIPSRKDSTEHAENSLMGVLLLGLVLELSPMQEHHISCMLRVLQELAQALSPVLSEQAGYAIGNIAPFFPPWQHPHPLGCRCDAASPSTRRPQTGRRVQASKPEGEIVWGGGACRDEDSRGDDRDGSAGASLARAGPSTSYDEAEGGPAKDQGGGGLGGRKAGGGDKEAAMHPFWLTFRDPRTEAKFCAWFAFWMSKVDYVGHLVLVGLSGMAVLKLLKTEAPSSPTVLLLVLILLILLVRLLSIVFYPAWFRKNRELLLMAFPFIYQAMTYSQFLSVMPGLHGELGAHTVLWLARVCGVFSFMLTTLFTMVRFKVSFLVHLLCLAVSIRKIPTACDVPKFQNPAVTAACGFACAGILTSVGFFAPHCLTWSIERKIRRRWRTASHHLD